MSEQCPRCGSGDIEPTGNLARRLRCRGCGLDQRSDVAAGWREYRVACRRAGIFGWLFGDRAHAPTNIVGAAVVLGALGVTAWAIILCAAKLLGH